MTSSPGFAGTSNPSEKWKSVKSPSRSPTRGVSRTWVPNPYCNVKFSYDAARDSAFLSKTSTPPFISR